MSTDFNPALIPQELSAGVEGGNILEQLQEIRDVINEFANVETWSEPFRHIMEGALAVHRLRLLDLSRREEVLFLELIEGRGLHVRAHDSQCFFYSEYGHWSAYNGVVPQGTLARCKTFLMQLEGLYSMFDNNVLRENEGILVAAQELLRQYGGRSEQLLEACEKAAICRVPPTKTKQQGHGEDDTPAQAAVGMHWTAVMANTIGKLYVKLQTSLLNDSVIKYYIEWCSIDVCQQGGFCTMDGCFVFDPRGGLKAVPKSPQRNVYVHLPHRMLDPVADDVKNRLDMFWKTTYWGNAPAFDVCMASLTLAFRGENVDRAFWGVGSGGVGQSLQTAHLEAILGNYHSCLDMNIYFIDEEMRKQAANLVGKIVVTGQESVQGSRRPMREDIYKKHISADKVPERLPYAIRTGLVELRGWKRFELNAYPKFAGVTEENINSIMRRTAVCRYKATFVDEARIKGREVQAAASGIFPRDPTLKDFLRDKPACLVTLRCIWNYARGRTAAECRAVLENYVVHGGDRGLTAAAVRSSCGLSVREGPAADAIDEALKLPHPGDDDPIAAAARAQRKWQMKSMQVIMDWLIDESKDWFTVAQLRSTKTKVVFSFNRSDAQEKVDELVAAGLLICETTILPKVSKTFIYVPRIATQKALSEVIPLDHDQNMVFTEECDWNRMRSRLGPDTSRMLNMKTLTQGYRQRHVPEGSKRGRGAPSKRITGSETDRKMKEELQVAMDRDAAMCREVRELVEGGEESADHKVAMQRHYFYPVTTRCRRFLKTNGAQNCTRLT
ncbi:unnamed protein product, partial [Symbiodinium necroappetens]